MNQESLEQLITDTKCPDCGKPLKHIPAGKTTKTNIIGEKRVVEYDEFWVCSDTENCGAKFNSWRLFRH
jgi:uncharacterized protein with PIN domain